LFPAAGLETRKHASPDHGSSTDQTLPLHVLSAPEARGAGVAQVTILDTRLRTMAIIAQ